VQERGCQGDGSSRDRHNVRERIEVRTMNRKKRETKFNFRVGLIFYLGGVYFNSDWVDFKWVCYVIS
jgi:hypothetical protein